MDAQKDSSIMKSIALLTMVFLPATFLAVSLVPINSLPLLILFTPIPAAKDGFYAALNWRSSKLSELTSHPSGSL